MGSTNRPRRARDNRVSQKQTRSPASEQRGQAPEGASLTAASIPLEFSAALRAGDLTASLWGRQTRFASMDRAIYGLSVIGVLLDTDETAQQEASDDGRPYNGLGDFHRGGLRAARVVLMESLCWEMDQLRNAAAGGEQ